MTTDAWQLESGLGPDPAGVVSVLVLRPGGLSAVVRAVPALRHLRDTYRSAITTVAADAPAMELLEACPFVDQAIDLARPEELLVRRWDVAVSFAPPASRAPAGDAALPGSRRANLLDLSLISHRFGAAWRTSTAAPSHRVHPAWPERLADSARMLRLAWLLGGSAPESSLGLWPTLSDRNGAARLVADIDAPIALVHVGAGTASRRWPTAGWARVIDLLALIGLHPVLVGSEDGVDIEAAHELEQCARRPFTSLVGATSVGQLAGLIERAALFVGGDSGPAVLATALGVRTVIVGPSSTIEHQGVAGRIDVVSAGPCTECGELTCAHTPSPARDVSAESVLAQVALSGEAAVSAWNAHQAR